MPEIVPTLHWIKGRASNIYLWTGEAGLVLIDAGMPGDVDTIFNYILKIGRRPSDIQAIFVTHADIDHVGGAAAFQAQTEAVIFAGRDTADHLTTGSSPKHMPRPIQFIIDRFMKFTPIPRSAIKQVEEGLPVPGFEDWQLLATPGHTPDHHAFFNLAEGLLLAGDALNTRGDRIQCSPARISADFAAARHSARRLLRLTPAVFACGHGRPLTDFSAGDVMKLDRQLS